jgi:hypothetical protein
VRSADAAEQARIDAALASVRYELARAGIHPDVAALLLDTAERTLHLRPDATHVGWLVTFHGDTDCTHHGALPQVVLDLVRGHGRLVYILDLGHHWRRGAGDPHLLGEAWRRIPTALGADEAEQRGWRP